MIKKSVLILFLCCHSLFGDVTQATLPRTDPQTIGTVYQILKVLDFELTNHKIPYWIDFGTLLGAVRHGGMIPWDDDADICIFETDKSKLESLVPIFENYGLQLTIYIPNCLYKLHRKGKIFPFVDIFFSFYDPKYGMYHPRNCFNESRWKSSDLKKIETIALGPLSLKAPKEGVNSHLFRFYGENCLTHAVFWNHSNTGLGRVVVELEDFSPADYEVTEDIIDLD